MSCVVRHGIFNMQVHRLNRMCFSHKFDKTLRLYSHTTKSACQKETPQSTKNPKREEHKLKVTTHLTLHKTQTPAHLKRGNKPLVLLFQWLNAKPVAVEKYCDLYHDVGLDVLTVRGKLSHFLWPPKGVELSKELFEYLKTNRPPDERLLIHAFSVGAYNYTIAMQADTERKKEAVGFRDRVVGQVFDSIVLGTFENMSIGIAQVLPKNRAFRKLVISSLGLYYKVTHKTTTETYTTLVDHFKTCPIPVPTLVIYSDNDPMCEKATMEKMLNDWRLQKPDFDVTRLSWPKSTHAAHLKTHREEYLAGWTQLMKKLKLL